MGLGTIPQRIEGLPTGTITWMTTSGSILMISLTASTAGYYPCMSVPKHMGGLQTPLTLLLLFLIQ